MYSFVHIVGLALLVTTTLHHVASIDENTEVKKYFAECFAKRLKLSCITEKATLAVENSMDIDLQLIPGIVLVRNDLIVHNSTGRDEKYGIDRFTSAVSKFLDSHSLTVEMPSEGRARKRRRFGYLLASMLATAGVTGAMMMKGIALIAGKALMVSKMALLLSAIIGLKKLFSKDDHGEAQVVQVHAMHDEHDRNLNSALYNIRHI